MSEQYRAPLKSNSVGPCQLHTFGTMRGWSNKRNTYYRSMALKILTCVFSLCISDCQFTCHHKCLSSIQLDCKSMSHEPPEDESSPLTGETSLSDLSTALQSTELSSEPATVSKQFLELTLSPPSKLSSASMFKVLQCCPELVKM